MKLLTVRLSEEDAVRVASLRERGIEISSLVREAIARQASPLTPRLKRAGDVDRTLEEIYSKFPDERGRRPSKLDLTDRKSVARALRKRFKRKRSY